MILYIVKLSARVHELVYEHIILFKLCFVSCIKNFNLNLVFEVVCNCIYICGAKGSGRPGPFQIISPRAQPRRKTSEDD